MIYYCRKKKLSTFWLKEVFEKKDFPREKEKKAEGIFGDARKRIPKSAENIQKPKALFPKVF